MVSPLFRILNCLFYSLICAQILSAQNPTPMGETILLPAGLPIPVASLETLDSRHALRYRPFKFKALEDIFHQDFLIIEKGAEGWALISEVHRPDFFGKSGGFKLEFRTIKSAHGDPLFLAGKPPHYHRNDEQRYALGSSGFAAYHFGPHALFTGAGWRGFEAKIPAGYRFYTYSDKDREVKGFSPLPIQQEDGLLTLILKEEYFVGLILKEVLWKKIIASFHSLGANLDDYSWNIVEFRNPQGTGLTLLEKLAKESRARNLGFRMQKKWESLPFFYQIRINPDPDFLLKSAVQIVGTPKK